MYIKTISYYPLDESRGLRSTKLGITVLTVFKLDFCCATPSFAGMTMKIYFLESPMSDIHDILFV